MFCEAYRKTLIDAAAGADIEVRAQAHLASCKECEAAFAEEQALLAAIDRGVSQFVRCDAPPSLLPRVREAVAEEQIATRRFVPAWAWIPIAAVASLTLAAYLWQGGSHTVVSRVSVQNVPPARSMTHDSAARFAPPARSSLKVPRQEVVRASVAHSPSAEAEIRVLPQEEAGLIQFVAALRHRKEAGQALVDSEAGTHKVQPLQIAAMDWPQLSIKPLVEERSELAK